MNVGADERTSGRAVGGGGGMGWYPKKYEPDKQMSCFVFRVLETGLRPFAAASGFLQILAGVVRLQNSRPVASPLCKYIWQPAD